MKDYAVICDSIAHPSDQHLSAVFRKPRQAASAQKLPALVRLTPDPVSPPLFIVRPPLWMDYGGPRRTRKGATMDCQSAFDNSLSASLPNTCLWKTCAPPPPHRLCLCGRPQTNLRALKNSLHCWGPNLQPPPLSSAACWVFRPRFI